MSETPVLIPAKAYVLNEWLREFLQLMMSEETIPADARYFVMSEHGFLWLTAEELPTAPLTLMIPRTQFVMYYDINVTPDN